MCGGIVTRSLLDVICTWFSLQQSLSRLQALENENHQLNSAGVCVCV